MHYKDTQLVNTELYSIRFLNEEVDSASFVSLGSKEDGKDGVVWLYIDIVDFSTCFVLK